jgi:carbamoyl-phosphate synthase large subunit
MNILVTCAGGPAAVGVIKSLRDIEFDGKIVAVDCDELSVGFYLADKHYVTPLALDDKFWPSVLKIIKKENINLILPTGDADITHFAKNKKLFKSLGIECFMSDLKTINACQNKLKFYEKCKNNFDLPKTSCDFKKIEFPIFSKPKKGSGSRGIKLCYDISCINSLDINDNLHRSGDYIFQEYLPGQEYTIDVLCDLNNKPLTAVIRKRLQIKAGISSKGKIIKDKFIEKSCFELCKFLKLKGPVCIQMKEDSEGTPKFIEVNPRFGGSTYFATLAGINFTSLILDMIKGKKLNIGEPKLLTILRYYKEVIV